MIISEYVETTMHQKTINYYRSVGYIGMIHDRIKVKVSDLPKNSRVRICVKCDVCGVINNIIYNNYNRQINRQNYYCCHPCSFDKNRFTNFKKYGVEYSFQSECVKAKTKKTLIEKYGYDHPTKCPEIFKKAQSNAFKKVRYKDSELEYQGSYEKDFIEFCIEREINIESGPTIRYLDKLKDRIYHSDFYIRSHNLIVEVKSKYTLYSDYEENLLKMEYSLKAGFNFLFVVDKDYSEIKNIMGIND